MWYRGQDGQSFVGSYDYNKKGERYFELIELKTGQRRRYKYKSWQRARDLGWERV